MVVPQLSIAEFSVLLVSIWPAMWLHSGHYSSETLKKVRYAAPGWVYVMFFGMAFIAIGVGNVYWIRFWAGVATDSYFTSYAAIFVVFVAAVSTYGVTTFYWRIPVFTAVHTFVLFASAVVEAVLTGIKNSWTPMGVWIAVGVWCLYIVYTSVAAMMSDGYSRTQELMMRSKVSKKMKNRINLQDSMSTSQPAW